MTIRKRIIERNAQSTATRVLRTRRNLVAPDSEGDIVKIEEDDIALSYLKKASPLNQSPFRGGKYLHVSDLLGKCVRRIAISEKYDIQIPSQYIHESMALTFAQGTALHNHIRDRVFSTYGDIMFGSWSCRCGNLHTKPSLYSKVKTKKCQICGGSPTVYHELELRDPDLMVIGSPDLTLYLERYGVYYPIEIKSMAHDEWKELSRPKPDHVLQVLFYWYLLRKLGYAVPDKISILYVTKGFLFQTPYKEFIVTPEVSVSRLDEYLEEARMLKAARDGGEVPCRSFCSSRDCKTAKDCHVVNLCFQHK